MGTKRHSCPEANHRSSLHGWLESGPDIFDDVPSKKKTYRISQLATSACQRLRPFAWLLHDSTSKTNSLGKGIRHAAYAMLAYPTWPTSNTNSLGKKGRVVFNLSMYHYIASDSQTWLVGQSPFSHFNLHFWRIFQLAMFDDIDDTVG